MSLTVGKIVLKSSTSKTLSDRFADLAKSANVENVRQKKRNESTTSIKNKRLAANMAKRLGNSFEDVMEAKKPVKNRLGLTLANRLGNRTGRGQGRTRGGLTAGRGAMMTRSRGGATRGALRGRRGARGGAGRGGFRSPSVKRGISIRGGNRGTTRGAATARGGGRGRGRGGRGGKDISQAQLDQELDQYMSKTKYALDTELDQYMNTADK